MVYNFLRNHTMKRILLIIIIIITSNCTTKTNPTPTPSETVNKTEKVKTFPTLVANRYNVAFLVMDGTYNTEFTAPFDIFQHTQ